MFIRMSPGFLIKNTMIILFLEGLFFWEKKKKKTEEVKIEEPQTQEENLNDSIRITEITKMPDVLQVKNNEGEKL